MAVMLNAEVLDEDAMAMQKTAAIQGDGPIPL
jgi:hypothetical protein